MNHLEKLNYMERFYRHGYEELLMKSIERRPTIHTIFMMNRLINGGGDREFYMALLKKEGYDSRQTYLPE